MTNTKLDRLFQPGKIGKMEVKNRIVMPPMHTEYADRDGYINQRQIDYYVERAKGGCGLIIVEASCVQAPIGRGFITEINLDDDKYIPGLSCLAEGMKKNGARTCIQLYHAGCAAHERVTGQQPVGPSATSYSSYEASRALTRDEMKEVKQCFIAAAIRCQKAGLDCVMLHSCHQYLLSNFLSPVWNKRDDEYGGNLENRARFPIEILRGIKEAIDIPVLVRINAREYGGIEILGAEQEHTLEDAIELAKLYEANGADALHISSWGYGLYVYHGFVPLDCAESLPMVATIKRAVTIPVIGYGRLTPELAVSAIIEGKADFLGFGRGQIVDPYFVQKVAAGKLSEIPPCICCYKCLPVSQRGLETKGLHCSVNARAGYEAEYPYSLAKARKSKRVLIVGGGPGGMEAARVAALRGHRVTLYEKNEELGGQLLAADKAPEKHDMGLLPPYLKREIAEAGVRIELRKEATEEMILSQQPDVVIVAAGAQPLVPNIEGLEKKRLLTAVDVLTGRADGGEKVIVLGASMTGIEVSEVLAERGKKLTICEVLPKLGIGVDDKTLCRRGLKRLREHGAEFHVGITSEKATEQGMVIVDKDGNEHLLEADTIVLAAGSKPNDRLFIELEGKVPEVYCVGDAKEPRFVIDAVHEGFRVAYSL